MRTDCELFLCVCSLHNIMGVKLDLSLDQNDFAPFTGCRTGWGTVKGGEGREGVCCRAP